jgi:hypothetical protein
MRTQLRRQLNERRTGQARSRRADARAPHGPADAGAVSIELTAGTEERRVREAGGPQDRALYGCQCGCAFQADVTASVACPRCGTSQAW